jgi:HK97 family phage major capsid protein
MENRTFAIDTVEYREAFLLNLQGREMTTEQRAAVSASAAIPTQTMNKIVGKLELAPIINAVDVTYIPGNVSYPVEGTVNEASWVAMGTAATDSSDTVTNIALGAFKLIKTVEITADVAAMAVDAFEDWLVNRLANKLQRAVAAGIMTGTGSSQATGLAKMTATGTYTAAGMTYSDVMAIIAALPTQYAVGASFVMSRATFYGNVLNIQDTAKHPIVVADVQAPAKFNILGYPVILEDAAGTDVYFGDLKEGYKFNFAQAPTVKSDDSVAFRSGSTVYRAMALADGKPTGVGVVRYTKATA